MANFEVGEIVRALRSAREEWRDLQKRSREPGGREFPSRDALECIVEGLKGAMFPMRLGPTDLRHESEDLYVGHTLDAALQELLGQARLGELSDEVGFPAFPGRFSSPFKRCCSSN